MNLPNIALGGKCPESGEQVVYVRPDCFYVTRDDNLRFTARTFKDGRGVHVDSDGRRVICDALRIRISEWKNASADKIAEKILNRMGWWIADKGF